MGKVEGTEGSVYPCPLGSWPDVKKVPSKLQGSHPIPRVVTWVTWGWPMLTGTAMLSDFLPICSPCLLTTPKSWAQLGERRDEAMHSPQWINARLTSQLIIPRSHRETKLWLSGTRQNCQKQAKSARKLWNQSHSSICSKRVSNLFFFFFVKIENKNTRQTGRLARTSFLWEGKKTCPQSPSLSG